MSDKPQDCALSAQTPEEIQQMLHELRIHQVELEMQNEELRTAQQALKESRARYFDLYDLAPVGYCTVSEKGLVLEVNLTAATLLGTARSALLKQPLSRLILKEDQDIYYRHRKQLLATGEAQKYELRMVKPDGAFFWAHLTEIAAQADDGAPVCRIVFSDISERKRADDLLTQSERRFRDIAQVSADWIWEVDTTGRYTYASESVRSLLGYAPDEIIGKTPFDFMTPEEADRVGSIFAAIAQRADPFRDLENKVIDASGRAHDTLTSGVPIYDACGACIGYRGVDRDISENKRLETELIRQARVDYLTGLNNRRYFMARMEEERKRAARYGQVLSVGMIDIDDFKKINDQYGHKTGDAVLKVLAEVCGQTLRDVDIVGRLGGEEFALLMPETDSKAALDVAERLRAAMAGAEVPFEPGAAPIRFTVSIGVATKRSADDCPEALLNLADQALYRAKGAGKNRVCAAE